MMGLSEINDAVGKHISQIAEYSPDKSIDKNELHRSLDSNDPGNDMVLCFICTDGRKIYNRIYSTKIDYMGRPVILSMHYDITMEKEREEELISREKRFRDMVEHSKDAIYITDFNDNIIEANRHACDSL